MAAIGRLLGGGRAERAVESFRPVSFRTPGGSGTFRDNQFTLSRSPETTGALRDIRSGFQQRAEAGTTAAAGFSGLIPKFRALQTGVGAATEAGVKELGGLRGALSKLRGEVKPGFGRLTESRVAGVRAAGQRTVGNLREELSRRRVQGSSFAAREIGAVESEFSRQEDLVRAESFVQELGLSSGLIAQEAGLVGDEAELQRQGAELIGSFLQAEGGAVAQRFAAEADAAMANVQGAATILDQLNLETNLAANISAATTEQINANLMAQAQARQFSAELGLDFLDAMFAGLIEGGVIGG